jgi:putative heme-binding domain-containing protein
VKMNYCRINGASGKLLRCTVSVGLLLAALLICGQAYAQEAQWIWSPEHPRNQAPQGDCYFRRVMQLDTIEEATITITADDKYDLFINGRLIGNGKSIRQMEQYDVTQLLRKGTNVVGIKVTNMADGPAAVAARVLVKPKGKNWLSYSTGEGWRTQLDRVENWSAVAFKDNTWKPAQVFGMLGETAPWDRREEVNSSQLSENQRFQINQEFVVEEILDTKQVGSLINMAFNEFGHIIASREGGPLLLIYDSNKDGIPDKTRDYCDLVENIQGILPLNGDVYVTGDGKEGSGIYRLIDEDRNGSIDKAEKTIGFKGQFGEHGAHGLTLGLDGYVYCVLGNHVQYDGEFASNSSYQHPYEGDLVQPRMEDPGGHAQGVKAPGGTVIRVELESKKVELVAGGLRNAFDLVFHGNGRLFVHDSDMEADEGSVWYRPTALYEVAEGAEFGWRSGWASWPNYYIDRLPATLETGRGSPAGGCAYGHVMFPRRYHNSLFLADWSKGQILSVKIDDKGVASSEVFLQGQPLNVTDVAVGPDGWLYFCTGGRGTKGGIYQVRWTGKVPESIRDLGSGITRALKQPQLDSAWGRQAVAALKRELGSSWAGQITAIANSNETAPEQRVRALELMQLFGPAPSSQMLVQLASSKSEIIRAKAASLAGLLDSTPELEEALTKLLMDSDPLVQRAAGESLVRGKYEVDASELTALLKNPDRKIAWAGRLLLQRLSADQISSLLQDSDQRVRLQAALALSIAHPTKENCLKSQQSMLKLLDGFISDRNLIDVLRVIQVALHRGGISRDEVPDVAAALHGEYPIGESSLNRELFRLLTYLNVEQVIPEAITMLQQDLPLDERMHVAMHLSMFKHDWTAAERYAIVKFFEESQLADSGSSVPLYTMNLTRTLCEDLPLEEARIFVAEGAKWPNAALVSLFRFPEKLSAPDLSILKALDQEIDRKGFEAEQFKRLRTGLVAMLSQHGDDESQQYLREIWIRSPERRQAVALGLAQFPSDENWDYLVRSLPVLESFAVPEVLQTLRKIPAATDDSQAIREVILHGLRMEQDGESPRPAIDLLAYWVGQSPSSSASDKATKLMSGWQEWFNAKYTDQPKADLPKLENTSPWSMESLAEYFATSEGRKGDSEAGKLAYSKAKCADCHKADGIGKSIGPDLSSVASRFTRKEVLESILFPSHVISDQYRSYRVLTTDGKVYSGLMSKNRGNSVTIRDSELKEHTISEENIESIQPSSSSMMPSGLFDRLTSGEIRDLMTFMGYVPDQPRRVAEGAAGAPANKR